MQVPDRLNIPPRILPTDLKSDPVRALRSLRRVAEVHPKPCPNSVKRPAFESTGSALSDPTTGSQPVTGLSTRNFNFKKGERKLAPTFIPVKVLKRIGDIAYEVDLPKKYKKMHNVVGVNLLEPWHGEPKIKGKLPEISEDLEVWEVEQITDHRKDGEQTWYRIKWKGWPVEYNTWEPEANVKDSPDLLKEYKDRKKHAKWEDYPVRS
ncbi:uncharacterized protein BROUX77_004769 [Berkeleyomyces rouxiae]|uniref:uncharacterized protein n=1 Tax=Berkeleyomyces rouxiae TaxID=2035830 RepID=UPI003B7F6A77